METGFMDAEKMGKCKKCKESVLYKKNPFVPAVCKCGHRQIRSFKRMGIEFQKVIASSPVFLIYQGYYSSKNLFVDITVLRKDLPDYKWCLQVAKEQAELLMKLRTHHILPLFEYCEIDDNFCLLTPTLDGAPLSKYIPEQHGLIAINNVVNIFQATSFGMSVAHQKNIIHHNINSNTIHIDGRGIVRINGFFISRFIYIYDQKRIERENHIYTSVSPYYISPEKAESGTEDKRGDIFSLGVMFYYLLTGKFPFKGHSDTDTIYKRIQIDKNTKKKEIEEKFKIKAKDFPDYIPPESPCSIRKSIPENLSDLIMQMLSYYPNNRPSFAEIIDKLELFMAKVDLINIRKSQEEIIDSDTKSIPKMASPFRGRAEDQQK